MIDNRAVFYVTNRTEDAERAVISARSLYRVNPDIDTYLFYEGSPYFDKTAFTYHQQLEEMSSESPWYLRQTKYIADILRDFQHRLIERVVFLDCDTYVCSDISDLFRMLTAVDMACAIAPRRYMDSHHVYIPTSFPEWNTGVMPIRVSDRTIKFWKDFFDFYTEGVDYYGNDDQIPLRSIMYKTMANGTDLRFFCLAPEWNFRFNFACQATREVKILHAKSDNLAAIAAKANVESGIRAWENGIRLD